jgi:hypothetical protein
MAIDFKEFAVAIAEHLLSAHGEARGVIPAWECETYYDVPHGTILANWLVLASDRELAQHMIDHTWWFNPASNTFINLA